MNNVKDTTTNNDNVHEVLGDTTLSAIVLFLFMLQLVNFKMIECEC